MKLCLHILAFNLLITTSLLAQEMDSLSSGQAKNYRQYTNPGNNGYRITNGSTNQILVPLKFKTPDFMSLINNPPSGVSTCGIVDGGWSGWTSGGWSGCSASCGTGTMYNTSYRYCNSPTPNCGGNSCSGASTSTSSASCNTGVACSTTVNYEFHSYDTGCDGNWVEDWDPGLNASNVCPSGYYYTGHSCTGGVCTDSCPASFDCRNSCVAYCNHNSI